MAELEQPPSSGPTPESLRAQQEWVLQQAESLPLVRASAEKWRNGLLGLFTLVTTGLVVAGPEKTNDMVDIWRWGVTGGLLGGLLAVVVGLLLALGAAAGKPARMTFEDFVAAGGDRQLIDAGEAGAAVSTLAKSRLWSVVGIFLLLISLGVWMVSPTPESTSRVEVTTPDEVLCGELKSGDQGHVRLELEGESQPAVVPFSQVDNLRVVGACDVARLPR